MAARRRSGAFGLSLPNLLEARTGAAPAGSSFGKAKACILLFHLGGPPQHETWDPKDDTPVEIRGDLKSIATNVPGIRVGELMPRTADARSHLRTACDVHQRQRPFVEWLLDADGHATSADELGERQAGAPNDWPCTAAIVNRLRRGKGGLPAAITLPEHIWNTGGISWPGQDGGFLGRTADPWLIHCDPSTAGFRIPGLSLAEDVSDSRLNARLSLLEQVNQRLDAVERGAALARFNHRSQQAFDLLRAGKARRAFDLDSEPPTLRDRYGRNRWGQSVLLARRLIETGVSLVQVNWTRMPGDTNDSPAWDTHHNNAKRLKNNLMPPMDLAYSALLEDLDSRGLLQETLVVWMGEFGRSPKINGNGGRDHWGRVFSVALAGGGVRGGQVIGASDKTGGLPNEGRVSAPRFNGDGFPLPGPSDTHRDSRQPRPPPGHQPRRSHLPGGLSRSRLRAESQSQAPG